MGDVAGFEFLADIACPGAEVLDAGGEGIYVVGFLSFWQERMFPMDLFDRGDDMGQTGLPVSADTVIGCIAITHQRAGEVLSEYGGRTSYYYLTLAVNVIESLHAAKV